jgi:serine-type D-Ala-D-Ala carboxypeptidase/endopeptidase (penicillin-binding protein 4)
VKKTVLALSLIATLLLPAQAATLDEQITASIAQTHENLDVGIKAIDLNSGKVIYKKNSSRYFMPASNLKLFTGFAALKFLGPDFVYHTSLQYDQSKIKQHTLNGDVAITFSGDPTFDSINLYKLLKQFSKDGITTINGNIQLDVSAFDDDLYANGWPWDQLHICYSGPISAANLNRNCTRFLLKPDTKNNKASITPITNLQFMPIKNEVQLKQQATCPLQMHTQENNAYVLSGCLSPSSGPITFMASVADPVLFMKTVVLAQLKQLSVKINGEVIVADHSSSLPIAAQHDSKKLSVLITAMLKKSDNLIANSLLKTLGGAYYNSQGSWANGMSAIKKLLKKHVGIAPKTLSIADGSGESYYDKVTPQQVTQLLNVSYNDELLKKYFIPALPISRVDGTLIHRLKNMKGIVHAKTGTKRDANALSGYVFKEDGSAIAFSIMTNGGPSDYKTYYDLEDRIVELLAES